MLPKLIDSYCVGNGVGRIGKGASRRLPQLTMASHGKRPMTKPGCQASAPGASNPSMPVKLSETRVEYLALS